MKSVFIGDDEVPVTYTSGSDLAVYPLDELETFVPVEQAKYEDAPKDLVRTYFWWYRYLLLNETYAEQCKLGVSSGPYQRFFSAWGDIFAAPFCDWWPEYGVKLAGLRSDASVARWVPTGPKGRSVRRSRRAFIEVDVDRLSGHGIAAEVSKLIDSPIYPPENVTNFDLLHWGYEAYIGKLTTDLTDAAVGYLVGMPQPKSHRVDEAKDEKADMKRRIGDLKRTAREIIEAALDRGRFPFYRRRRGYK